MHTYVCICMYAMRCISPSLREYLYVIHKLYTTNIRMHHMHKHVNIDFEAFKFRGIPSATHCFMRNSELCFLVPAFYGTRYVQKGLDTLTFLGKDLANLCRGRIQHSVHKQKH